MRFFAVRPSTAVICAALALCAFFRFLAVAGPTPAQFPDTSAYLSLAATPLGSLTFWLGPRPPLLPLFLKLVGTEPARVAFAQVCVSTVGWGWLAVAVARCQTSGVGRTFALGAVLAISLTSAVVQWDRLLLSESLSLSLMAATLAGALELTRTWRLWCAVLVVCLAILWSGARDGNGLMLGLLGGAVAVMNVIGSRARRWFVLAGTAAAICLASQAAAGASERWEFPFYNVVAQRVLPDASARDYFKSHGMPVTPALLRLSGQWASTQDGAFFRDPGLATFRSWSLQHGRSTYAGMLASRPLATLRGPWKDRAAILTPDVSAYGTLPAASSVQALTDVLAAPWVALLAGVAGLAGLLLRRPSRVSAVLACFAGAALAGLLIVWHADAMEVPRHELATAIQLRLCSWILLGSAPWAYAWRLAARYFSAFRYPHTRAGSTRSAPAT